MNIKEIAAEVLSDYKSNVTTDNSYFGSITYVPILDDGSIRVSSSPTVLIGQKECILILWSYALAATNYYPWYKLCFIDKEGVVHDRFEINGCSITTTKNGRWSNDAFEVSKLGVFVNVPFYHDNKDKVFIKVWQIFQLVSICETAQEVRFVSQIQDNEKTIEELKQKSIEAALLEKERDQYKSMLDELKQMVEHHVAKN